MNQNVHRLPITIESESEAITLPARERCSIEVVLVNAVIASAWLHRNSNNRPIRHKAVSQYACDMTGGQWKSTGESIKFSKSGRLLDGQHRLSAIVEADAIIDVVVNTGLEDGSFDVIDTGRHRTGSDILTIDGISLSEARTAAAALPMIVNFSRGLLAHSSARPTNQAQLDFWKQHPYVQPASRYAALLPKRYPPISHAKAMFLHWRFAQIDPEAAEDFLSALFTGGHLSMTESIYHLRAKLMESRMQGVPIRDGVQIHACFKAWNLYRAKREVRTWRSVFPRADEKLPELI
ncbi:MULTISPECIES: hypothetical protein [unclassified Lysobacter]|uniref:hypothetical protein n=1 Tax=unclassified Lysobacter TaxID=2635362 RepID=UPI001BED321F|nr:MULTISPECIES: hypothetical protein [unclassified Lysobacter]MBT2748371.1 hypothetical protein [Lysobacter sp. ISL-42]MBT2749862.1 hypothetical protein [Lysobacter sp. ISL-50]MBT2781190.1 hypothetical protein [Lysobacter sp. ISL-52]